MSAIFGVCTWTNEKIDILPMEETLREYCIDRMERIEEQGVSLGCGIQYFTEEAKREELPKKSSDENILLTADVVLDNQEELLEKLHIKEKHIPDGELVFQSFLRWGNRVCLLSSRGFFFCDI